MKKGTITGLLAGVCAVLLVLCILVYVTSDRTPPVIRFSDEEISYGEGQDMSVLLEGVEASDNRDGSVGVYVEGIYPLENNRAKVYYAAADESGNVAKASRIVNYGTGDGTEGTPSEEGGTSEETGEQPAETPETEPPETEATEPAAEPGAPVITLNTTTAQLAVGSRFQYANYIQSITDDEDSQDTLYRRINLEGPYDTGTPGTYTIQYIVYDSDGNRSAPATLTLVVQ